MKSKYTGWIRLGILISFLWILSISGILASQYISSPNAKALPYFISMKNCSTGEISKLNKAEAIELANLEYERANSELKLPDFLTEKEMNEIEIKNVQKNSVFTKTMKDLKSAKFVPIILFKRYLLICFIPVLIGWILICLFYFSIAWVIKGFKRNSTDTALNPGESAPVPKQDEKGFNINNSTKMREK